MPTVEWICPADHPAFEGHFPANPVMPGAVMLGEILRAIGACTGTELRPHRIRSAKFFYPTRPGDRLVIEFSMGPKGDLKFTCVMEGRTVLTADVECRIL